MFFLYVENFHFIMSEVIFALQHFFACLVHLHRTVNLYMLYSPVLAFGGVAALECCAFNSEMHAY